MKRTVYIVHSVDTEGPLFESVRAKFERIKELFGLDFKQKNYQTINKLKNKKISLNGVENQVSEILNDHLTNYNDNWNKINLMIKKIYSKNFRNKFKDSFNNAWVFNWHCLDHVGYKYNPRKRDLGYHKVFDRYHTFLKKYSRFKYKDEIHWHFHPMSTYKEAHRCATSYVNSPELYQIISRRIIDRDWFPSVNRAGFHAERLDSHLFLEQWIPFDLSNLSFKENKKLSLDMQKGRGADWRRATNEWEIYHPHHDDYQIKGNCRRWIARVLNIKNRFASINQKEMDYAFNRANKGIRTLVGVTSHDFRNLEIEVEEVFKFIRHSSKKYPKVKFYFSEAKEAFQKVIYGKKYENTIKFEVNLNTKEKIPYIIVKTTNGKVFGPQPFLAIKTKSGRYIHDNFDFDLKKNIWFYSFYHSTIDIKNVESFGVAANDKFGNSCIKRFKILKNLKLKNL